MSWSNWLDRFLVPLDDPGSRLFHLNIIIALLLVGFWVYRQNGTWPQFKKLVLHKKYWWNRSTRTDYKVYFLNSLLKVFLFIPFLDGSFYIARAVTETSVKMQGDFLGVNSSFYSLFLFTIAAFVWDDFLRFCQHLIMHKVPWLWKIHAMHHSARVLTPMTLFRNHPLESAIATVRNSLSLGVATGFFIFIFESRYNLVTLFGVNALGFMFNLLGANLRHSHIPITFGPFWEKIFISPYQHQIHHSRQSQHFNKNFGISLAVWDQLIGSLVLSGVTKKLRVGIPGKKTTSFTQELLLK